MRVKILLVLVGVLTLSIASQAQTGERPQANSSSQAQEQSSAASFIDPVANEIGLLRKSLQTLNTRLREISDRLFAPVAKPGEQPKDQQSRISQTLNLLSQTELRAEVLRKQLLELIEKETSLKTRLLQVEEELRPESIERAILVGSTRTMEMREARRRMLENERKGAESLLTQTSQMRQRLEEDVRQADALVTRLRLRVFPVIEKEIDKLNPNQ